LYHLTKRKFIGFIIILLNLIIEFPKGFHGIRCLYISAKSYYVSILNDELLPVRGTQTSWFSELIDGTSIGKYSNAPISADLLSLSIIRDFRRATAEISDTTQNTATTKIMSLLLDPSSCVMDASGIKGEGGLVTKAFRRIIDTLWIIPTTTTSFLGNFL
jgi:hypothetical protein